MTNHSHPMPIPRRLARRPYSRSGFTLIELLTVIGIILILVALSIVGYSKLNRSAKDNATHAALQSLRAWTTELEASTDHTAGRQGLEFLKIPFPPGTVKAYQDPTIKVAWASFPPPAPTAFNLALDATLACGDVNIDSADISQTHRGRYGDAVQATSIVMGRLMSLPSVKAAIDKMPSKAFLQDRTGNAVYKYSGPWSPGVVGGPVLLDGYGNPIIFVPAAGLRNVDRGGTQSGTAIDHSADPITGLQYRGPIRGRDDKPFWASAGADGKFTGQTPAPAKPKFNEGDDNVYSFDQQ